MAGKKNHMEYTSATPFKFLRTITAGGENVDSVSQIIDLSKSDRGNTNIIYIAAVQAVAAAANFFNIASLTMHLFYNPLSIYTAATGDPAMAHAWSRIAAAAITSTASSFVQSFTGLPAGQFKIVIPAASFTGTIHLLHACTM